MRAVVLADGERIEARTVITAMDPQTALLRLLDPPLGGQAAADLAAARRGNVVQALVVLRGDVVLEEAAGSGTLTSDTVSEFAGRSGRHDLLATRPSLPRRGAVDVKRLAALTITMAALAAACGSDDADDSAATADPTASGATAEFNEADVTFAQGMIPHHDQAVEMAVLAEERGESAQVKDLAARIEAAQDPEVELMTGWLADWDETVDGGSEMGGMGGVMSDEDMSALEGADGSAFDEQFLEMMAEHHRGAIEMAETEVAEGEFVEALDLAEGIIDTQTAEIAEIEELLAA